MTPETATTCHYFWAFVRNHRTTEQKLTSEIREGVGNIFREDELILEAQQRAMRKSRPHLLQPQYRRRRNVGGRVIDRMVAQETAPQSAPAAE